MIHLSIGLITDNEEIPLKPIQVSSDDRMELIIFNNLGSYHSDYVVLCGDTEIWNNQVMDLDISQLDGLELMVYDKNCDKYKVLIELRKAYKNATDKMAQFFIKTPLAHVEVKINETSLKALIDTGAQLSVISKSSAQKSGILGHLDSRFHVDAAGIGGFQKALGKILDVELELSGCVLPVVLTVFEENPMEAELILGVDVLTAYGASVDFKIRTITFNNDIEVKMMPI